MRSVTLPVQVSEQMQAARRILMDFQVSEDVILWTPTAKFMTALKAVEETI